MYWVASGFSRKAAAGDEFCLRFERRTLPSA